VKTPVAAKQIVPQLGLDSFSCPHCGAISQQSWYKGCLVRFERETKPTVQKYEPAFHVGAKGHNPRDSEAVAEHKRQLVFLGRFEKNFLTYKSTKYNCSSTSEMVNFAFSHCFACDGFGIWVRGELIFPDSEIAFVPHDDMSREVRRDFEEAASIVAKSPRGAAALLRLCIQKLVVEIGESGENLNADIRSLVEQAKISGAIQQALDVVRVVGNNAVHPGTINFNDDKTVATNLFGLVNLIVEAAIATPKHVKAIYEAVVPESVRKAIEKQDESNKAD
jgi:hypothetical protein